VGVLEKLFSRFRREEEQDEDAEMIFTAEAGLNYDRDPFLHSLRELKPEDIRLSADTDTRSKKAGSDLLNRIFLYVCVAVLIGSSVMLIDNLIQKEKGAALYEEAASEFAAAGLDFGFSLDYSDQQEGAVARLRKNSQEGTMLSLSARNEAAGEFAGNNASSSVYDEQLEKLRAVIQSYKARNEDVYGYISIPAVGIEYVMVQGADNDYYLNHNYLNDYLVSGSIFVDYRCEESITSNFNTVIYGHNITTNGGAMFHGVTEFFDREIFENERIYIYTMDGVYVYQPFSIYETRPDSGYIRTAFLTYEDFGAFTSEMQARSKIPSNMVIGDDSRIITLSPCTNRGDGKYALHAVLVEYIT